MYFLCFCSFLFHGLGKEGSPSDNTSVEGGGDQGTFGPFWFTICRRNGEDVTIWGNGPYTIYQHSSSVSTFKPRFHVWHGRRCVSLFWENGPYIICQHSSSISTLKSRFHVWHKLRHVFLIWGNGPYTIHQHSFSVSTRKSTCVSRI